MLLWAPQRIWARTLLPLDTNWSNQRVRTYSTRTCQQTLTTPQTGAARVRVPDVVRTHAARRLVNTSRCSHWKMKQTRKRVLQSPLQWPSDAFIASSSDKFCDEMCLQSRCYPQTRLAPRDAHTRRASPPGQARLPNASERVPASGPCTTQSCSYH